MSEFKFACPVCGQHMMCDESHGGSVMECPTCFQKIVAPQAPAPDAKFILTGSLYVEKKIPETLAGSANLLRAPKRKTIPAWLFLLILISLAAASAYFFGGSWWGRRYSWKSVDVGHVHTPGSFRQVAGKLTLFGDGADIWGRADAFHYVCVALVGDGEITGWVLNLQNTDPWAKAGVMFRESFSDNAKFATAFATPAAGISFQMRSDAGGPAASVVSTPDATAPRWFRLQRQGNTFTADTSVDGTKWTTLGTTNIVMTDKVLAGLMVCSHSQGSLCRAQFDHVTIRGHTETPLAMTNVPAGKPVPVAPPANDANWTTNLDQVTIPDATVVGRIHGQDFILERAIFTGNGLTLRRGHHGPVELGVSLEFGGAPPEELANRTLNITPDTTRAPRVVLRWQDDHGKLQKSHYDDKYVMRLEFGKIERGRLRGNIYLCTPDDEKSYLMGKFTAAIVRPKPKS